MNRFSLAVASVSLLTPSLTAAFDGPYAPELWTFTSEAGGFIDEHTADTLVLLSGDIGLVGDTDLIITTAADGVWTFDWTYFGARTVGFDTAYYLINGVEHFIASSSAGSLYSGSVSVLVNADDIIGYRNETTSGDFGPGTLIITNFTAPVPASPAFALILAALASRRRQRRYDPVDDG